MKPWWWHNLFPFRHATHIGGRAIRLQLPNLLSPPGLEDGQPNVAPNDDPGGEAVWVKSRCAADDRDLPSPQVRLAQHKCCSRSIAGCVVADA